MSTFTMPAVGTDEYKALVEKWEEQPVTWGTLKAISYRFRTVGDWSKMPLSEEELKILNYRSIRNDKGHLVNCDRDKGYTQWQGHRLIELLNKVAALGVITDILPVKPPVAESKISAPVTNTETVPFLTDGMFVRVRLENGTIENMRVNVSGKRVYLGSVK